MMTIQSDDNSAAAHSDHHGANISVALKEKWIEALRSGAYKQCTGELKSIEGAYCCLGVLAVVAGFPLDKPDQYKKLENLVGGYGPLVVLNDDKEEPFAKIADYIEANIPARPNGDRTDESAGSEVA